MSKKFEFEGSGFKGAEFEQKGLRERNLQVLLKTLSNKNTQKSIESLAQIEEKDWKAISTVTTNLKSIVDMGGFDASLISGWTDSISDTFKTELEAALAPLKNELIDFMNKLIAPFLPAIQAITTDINTMIQRGMGAIEALLTGKFDEFLLELQLDFQAEGGVGGLLTTQQALQSLQGALLTSLVYGTSEPHDLDYDVIEEILANLDLGGYVG